MSTTLNLDSQPIPFVVRRITRGERYGLNNKLTHEKDDPLVEFYDGRHVGGGPHTEFGQFISRYYESTLTHREDVLGEYGIDLEGMVPAWKVNAAGMKEVLEWIKSCQQEDQDETVGNRSIVHRLRG